MRNLFSSLSSFPLTWRIWIYILHRIYILYILDMEFFFSFQISYLCFIVYSFVTSLLLLVYFLVFFRVIWRFSFIRISVYTIPCFSHGLCLLYDLWISHYVIYSFFYHLLSFVWLTFSVITYGIFIARKFWKWRWFLRQKECLENLEFNFFPQSFEKRLERGDKWFSKKMEKILSFKCVCAL